MGHLHLSLLGTPRCRHDDTAVDFATRKTLALLVYLVVEGGMHRREKLAAILWPENDAGSGRTNLRNTLVHLRRPLRHKNQTSHLIVERNALGFNPEADFTCDWRLLQEAVGAPDAAALQAVVDRYGGDFLDGFSLGDAPAFDEWATLQREQAHRQLETIFDRLSQMQTDAGKTAVAHTTLNQWLSHNPLSEPAYRRLMRLHLVQGDVAAARAAYEQCATVLARELGTKPSAKTEDLRLTINNLRWEAPVNRQSSIQNRQSLMPLIGRADAFQQLTAVFHQNQPQVIVIRGASGLGKTRLAVEFCRWAQAQAADVLRGRAYESGGRLPYRPLVEALRPRIEAENAPEDLLGDVWLTELSRLLPELRDRYPDLPPPTSGDAAQGRLFEAVTCLGLALAQKRPLLLFMDDVQWADAATRDLLHYAARRWIASCAPVLLLLAVRDEALAREQGLRDWLDGLEEETAVTHLQLTPFTPAQTAELVQQLTGADAPTFAEWLHRETGGQPFTLAETLKALREQDWVREVETDDGIRLDVTGALVENGRIHPDLLGFLPPGVHKVVRQRLGRISNDGFTLAVAAAVVGRHFRFGVLCRVARMDEMDALPLLDELLQRRLLQETGEAGRPYGFAHDKIRDIVYTEAGVARRRLFHRQALDVLTDENAPAAELAHHALKAGEAEAAVRHSITAGDAALAVFAVQDAIAYFAQAAQVLAEQTVTVAPDIRLHLYQKMGRANDILGELAAAETAYEQMLAAAEEAGDKGMQALALNRLADVKAYQRDIEAALARLDAAMLLAEQSDDKRALAETHWNIAHLGLYGADPAQMAEHGRQALTLAREVDDEELIARCLNALTYNARNQGQVEAGLARGEEALARYRALGDRALEADCLGVLSQLNLMAGRPQTAVDRARAALTISREIESMHGVGFNSMMLGLALLECGRLQAGWDVIQRLAALADEDPGLFEKTVASIMSGMMYRALDDFEAALAADKANWTLLQQTAVELPFPLEEVVVLALTVDYALQENWETAASHAQQIPLPAAGVLLFLLAHFRWWLVVEALWRADERTQAEALVQRLGALAEQCSRFRLPHQRSLATLSRLQGDVAAATGSLQTAVALAEEMDLPGEQWRTLAKLADLEAAQGNEETAVSLRHRAREFADFIAGSIDDPDLRKRFVGEMAV